MRKWHEIYGENLTENQKLFFEAYEDWKLDCMDELYEKGYSAEEINNCEICEDGSVHFHKSFYGITSAGFVTPWEKSEHWRE